MKIILLKDVDGMGKAGDLVDAKPGYARNYLFPRKIAIEANEENFEKWKVQKEEDEKVEAEKKADAEELKNKLEDVTVKIEAKGGDTGKLFGAITSQNIVEELKKQHGINIQKKNVELKENIKTSGLKEIPIRVYPEITANLKVEIETK